MRRSVLALYAKRWTRTVSGSLWGGARVMTKGVRARVELGLPICGRKSPRGNAVGPTKNPSSDPKWCRGVPGMVPIGPANGEGQKAREATH